MREWRAKRKSRREQSYFKSLFGEDGKGSAAAHSEWEIIGCVDMKTPLYQLYYHCWQQLDMQYARPNIPKLRQENQEGSDKLAVCNWRHAKDNRIIHFPATS